MKKYKKKWMNENNQKNQTLMKKDIMILIRWVYSTIVNGNKHQNFPLEVQK